MGIRTNLILKEGSMTEEELALVREARNAYSREYKRQHREEVRAYARQYAKDHPEAKRAREERYWLRRALKLQAEGKLTVGTPV